MGDDARIEAKGSKNDARASRFNPRVSIRASTTTNVIFNLTIRALNLIWFRAGLVTLTVRLLFSDQVNGSPITSSLGPERKFQGLQAGGQRSKRPHIACKAPSPPPDPICPLY